MGTPPLLPNPDELGTVLRLEETETSGNQNSRKARDREVECWDAEGGSAVDSPSLK